MARKEKKNVPSGSVLGVPARNLTDYVKFFEKNDLRELTIRERGTTIFLKKDGVMMMPAGYPMPSVASAVAPAAPAGSSVAAPVEAPADDKYDKITTPIIGTYYDAPAPGADSFVKEGQSVGKGDPVCIVEAMKVMNKISAEFSCKIVRKVAKNGQALRSGDVLFLVEKS